MSATYHGETTVRCYHDCRQEGCPSHRFRLVSKHGGYFVEEFKSDGSTHDGVDLPYDIAWINAIARLLANEGTPAEQSERARAKLEMVIREVRAELLSDGYHRPNEMILKMDAALGEAQE